jgi:hypothetical protein
MSKTGNSTNKQHTHTHTPTNLGQLIVDIFEIVLKVLLEALGSVLNGNPIHTYNRDSVHVLEENRLRDRGPVVDSTAVISMTTCSDLKVEWTVHLRRTRKGRRERREQQ